MSFARGDVSKYVIIRSIHVALDHIHPSSDGYPESIIDIGIILGISMMNSKTWSNISTYMNIHVARSDLN